MKKLLMIFICFASLNMVCGQSLKPETVASGGGFGQNGVASLSWTIGQPVFETYQNSSNILTNGFQQTKLTISTLVENLNSDFNIKVFPNPTTNMVTVETDFNQSHSKLYYQLCDLNGKLLANELITQEKQQIKVEHYKSDYFILNIYTENKQLLKSVKIIVN